MTTSFSRFILIFYPQWVEINFLVCSLLIGHCSLMCTFKLKLHFLSLSGEHCRHLSAIWCLLGSVHAGFFFFITSSVSVDSAVLEALQPKTSHLRKLRKISLTFLFLLSSSKKIWELINVYVLCFSILMTSIFNRKGRVCVCMHVQNGSKL